MISLKKLQVNTKEIKFTKKQIKEAGNAMQEAIEKLDKQMEESRKVCIRCGSCIHTQVYGNNKRIFRKESGYLGKNQDIFPDEK